MILLIVEEDRELLGQIISALGQAGGNNEAHTASCFNTARAAAAKLDHLDILVSAAFTPDGANAFALRDELKARFPNLRSAFFTEYDCSEWRSQIYDDPVFGNPPDAQELVEWARGVGLGSEGQTVPEPEPLDAVPVPASNHPGNDSQELPVASSLSAPGKRLGDYELVRLIGSDGRTETHFATQLSIDRAVALVLLKPQHASDDDAVREFRGVVRARARVSHPHIAPVYEGYEEGGALFYTRELIDGKHLPELHQGGRTLDDPTLVEMVRAISEGLSYLQTHKIAHDTLRTRHIYLGEDNQTRLANIATFTPEEQISPKEQIRYLGAKLAPFLNPVGNASVVGKSLLEKMRDPAGPTTYANLLTEVSKAKVEVAERATYKVATTRLTSKPKAKWLAIGAIASIALTSAIYFLTLPDDSPPEVRQLDTMLRVPGGEFIYGTGETATAATFWIDRSEVTISEYSEFLEALGLPHTDKFDHPNQPGDKPGHQPEDWENYFDSASRGAVYDGKRIDLNCPVVLVDWWGTPTLTPSGAAAGSPPNKSGRRRRAGRPGRCTLGAPPPTPAR